MHFKSYFLFLVTCAVIASANSNLINEKVVTNVDISTQLVKVSNEVTVVNRLLEPAFSYLYIIDPVLMSHLSYIEAYNEKETALHVNRVSTDDSRVMYDILFDSALPPGKTKFIKIESVFFSCFRSYPTSVKQSEAHFVLFTYSVYYYSNYFTEEQYLDLSYGRGEIVTVQGPTHQVVDLNNLKTNSLQYGPYWNVEPESKNVSIIHYQNNSPFLTVERIDRFVQISQWGYITVQDKIQLTNSGPKFTGPYQRSWKTDKDLPDTRVEKFKTSIPEYAFDVSVKDEIGSLTNFELEYDEAPAVHVIMRPRFVMYGGWKTEYEMSYTLPTRYHLTYDNEFYTFSLPVVDTLFPNMFIKEAYLHFILPEGAVFQDVKPYYQPVNNTESRYCYYMDIICREVISFIKVNLVEHHSKLNISVTYSYSQLLLFMKPIVFTVFIYLLFMLFLVYSRLTLHYCKDVVNTARATVRRSQLNRSPPKSENPSQTNELPMKQGGKAKKTQSKIRAKSKKSH